MEPMIIATPELQIGSILLIPIITALAEIIKRVIKRPTWAPWITAILTVAGYILVVANKEFPGYEAYIVQALTIIGIFLASTGVYEFSKNTARTAKAAGKLLKKTG